MMVMKRKKTISGFTKIVCVIGNPARHSLSPLIHNTGYKALDLDYVYLALEAKDLKKAFEGLKQFNVAGFNVTMPFKHEIMKYLDRVDEMARKAQAVNTVVNSNGLYAGYNTDGSGAVRALKKVCEIKNKAVLIYGAGGAARAIAFALQKEKAEIFISNQSIAKGKALASAVGGKFVSIANSRNIAPHIIINATPVGMKPYTDKNIIPKELMKKGNVIFDIVYNPVETKAIKEAKKAGCTTVNGVEMLLEQGFEAFEIITGEKAPQEEIRKQVYKELM